MDERNGLSGRLTVVMRDAAGRIVEQRRVDNVVFGIAWHRADGVHVAGHNTELDGLEGTALEGEGEIRCAYESLDLAPGAYAIDVAVHASDGLAYDYWCDVIRVRVTSTVEWPGVWAPPHRWEWDGEISK